MSASSSEPNVHEHHEQDATVSGASVLQKPTARFEWKKLLEEGATGRVHLVRDHWVSRDVVLKQVLPRFLEDESVLKRFFQKLSLTRPLLHKHLVPYYELHYFQLRWTYTGEGGASQDVLDTPSYYLSLPDVPGKTLDVLLEALTQAEKAGETQRPLLPLATVKALFLQITEALAYSHEQGVTHDGLTTASIFCELNHLQLPVKSSLNGHWLSVDLQRFENSHNRRLPSLLYMPPEQLKLIPHHGRLQQHDLFAMGIIAYQLLAGNYPYYHRREWEQFVQGDMKARPGIVVIDRYRRLLQGKEALGDNPRSVTDARQIYDLPLSEQLNPDIEVALMRCISLDPEIRPKSVREMMAMFEQPWSSAELRNAEELRMTKGEIRKLIHMGDLDLAMEELEIAVEDFPEDDEINFMNLTLQGLQALQMEQRQSQEELQQVHTQMQQVRKETSKYKVKVRAEVQEAEQRARELQNQLDDAHDRLDQFEKELVKRNNSKKELESQLDELREERKTLRAELEQLREQLQNNMSLMDVVSFERDRLEIEGTRRKKELLSAVVLVLVLLVISTWALLRKPRSTALPGVTPPLARNNTAPRTRPPVKTRQATPARRVAKAVTRQPAVTRQEVRKAPVTPPAARRREPIAVRRPVPVASRRVTPPPRSDTPSGPLFAKRKLNFATGQIDLSTPCFRKGYVYGCFYRCVDWSAKRICVKREDKKQCGCMRDVMPARVFPRVLKVSGRLSSSSVRRIYRRRYKKLRPCASAAYASMPKDSWKKAVFDVSWNNGQVSDVTASKDGIGDENISRCLRREIRNWTLPGRRKGEAKASVRMTIRIYPSAPSPWDRNCGKNLTFKCFSSCMQRVRRNGRRRCAKYGRRCGCVRRK